MSDTPTPVFRFPSDSPFHGITIKREDLSETGSHKFRYMKGYLEQLKKEGMSKVVLSTTGNAGISASFYGKQLGIKVICMMSDRGDMSKAAQIEQHGGFLIITTRPIRFSKYISKKYGLPLLRMSADDEAPSAYQSLGEEIIEQVPNADGVVNFVTSGTSTLGIAESFRVGEDDVPLSRGTRSESDGGGHPRLLQPAFHLVQAGRTNSLVKELHPEQIDAQEEERGVGLKQTPHQEELLSLIKGSQGDAWYVTEEQRQQAEKALAEYELETSFEGVSCFAVAQKLLKRYKNIVVIFSGKKWPQSPFKPERIVQSFEEVDQIFPSG